MTVTEVLLRQNAEADKRLQDLEMVDVVPVVARYTTVAGQSIPNNTSTIVDFDTLDFDPYAAVTTGAAWKFTAQVAGYYMVTARVLFNGTANWADGEIASLSLFKNGTVYAGLSRIDNMPTNSVASPAGSTMIHLAKGDYIDIRVVQASGAALALSTLATGNHVSIARIPG